VKRALLVVGLVVGLAGCRGATLEDACTVICQCIELFPSGQQECTQECVQDNAGLAIPQECLDCISVLACREFDDVNVCSLECGGGVMSLEIEEE